MTPPVHVNPEFIPETRPLPPPPPRTRDLFAAHYVLAYSDLVLFRFADGIFIGPCDWLRIESTYPLIIRVDDGVPLTRDEDVGPITTQEPSVEPSWDGAAGGTLNTRVRPAYSYTIERPVIRLSLTVTGDTGDYATAEVPGAIHLWIGNGKVRDVGLGRPIFHLVTAADFPGAALATIAPIRPTLHGNNAAAPTSGLIWVPSVVEILRIAVTIVWTGVVGVINSVRLNQIGQGANRFAIADWRPGVASPWTADLGTPITYENYQSRLFFGPTGDNRGALEVLVNSSQSMDTANVFLSCRSYQ